MRKRTSSIFVLLLTYASQAPTAFLLVHHRRGELGTDKLLFRSFAFQQKDADRNDLDQFWESGPFSKLHDHLEKTMANNQTFVADHHHDDATITDCFESFYRGYFYSSFLSSNTSAPSLSSRYNKPKRRRQSFRLDFAYNGRYFCGWQRQPHTSCLVPSIQQVMEDSLSVPSSVDIRVAGRTDAGVHAVGQVGRVRVHPEEADILYRSLQDLSNANPFVWSIRVIDDKFHPSFGATSRSYVYVMDATRLEQYCSERSSVDDLVSLCNVQLQQLEGKLLDYYSLSHGKIKARTTECFVMHARARKVVLSSDTSAAVMVIEVTGNRFLRRMMRKLVGTVLELAFRGCEDATALLQILEERERSASARAVPADGLVLVGVSYD